MYLSRRSVFYEDGKDHLGSIRQIIHKTADYGSNNITGARDFYPYGIILRETNNAEEERFKFTEKERDKETDLDYFGARYYDSGIGRWTTADPLEDKYYGWSPYAYTLCNPLNLIDINGDSTFVIPGNNDSYTVIGGNLNGLEDDTGIYIKNVDGTVTLVGNSITSYSFFGDDGNAVIGAIIYMSSNEGQNFVFNGIIKGHPSLISYMLNATGGGKYDFKTRGISNKPTGITLTQYMYRGSQTIIPPKN